MLIYSLCRNDGTRCASVLNAKQAILGGVLLSPLKKCTLLFTFGGAIGHIEYRYGKEEVPFHSVLTRRGWLRRIKNPFMNDILILLLLLVLSGLFSGSETALTAISLARAEALVKEGRAGARALLLLKRNATRMLIALLIGNNLVNIGASAFATVVATEHLGALGPGVAVGVLTFLILVFGEITPKSMAIQIEAGTEISTPSPSSSRKRR